MDNNSECNQVYFSKKEGKDILVLKNIPTNANYDTLENYLEVVCDVEVDHFYFHELPNDEKVSVTALVFLKEKVPDFRKTQEKVKRKKIEGQVVELCRLNDPTGIVVHELPGEATEDDVTLYFERRKIAGSNAEVVQCTLHGEIHVAVLEYREPDKALQNVLKIKHMIRSKELTVEPYYKDFHDEVIKSQTRLSPGDPYLKQHDGNEIKEMDEDGYDTGGRPKENEFVENPYTPLVERIKENKFDESYDSLLPLVPDTPRPSEKVTLEKGKIVLLQKNRFSNECKECRIELNAVEECVIFNGGKAAILDAKLKMYKRLEDIVEVTRTVSKDLVSFLLSKLSWVKEILKRERVNVYITTKNDDLICCQAFSKPVAEKGLMLVLSYFDHVEVPYTEVHFVFLNSSDWNNLESKLTKDSEVVVDVVRKKKTIVISGKKSECRSAADKIKKNLCSHADAKSQKIEIKGSKSVCFHHGCQTEIKRLENEMSKKNGSLSYKHNEGKQTTVIELKADPATLEEAKTKINVMISSIWQGQVDLQRISSKDQDVALISKVLDSGRGRKFLTRFESKHRCGVEVQKTKGTHDLHHVQSMPSVNKEELPDMQRRHSGGARPKDTTGTFQGRNQWICSTNFGSIEIILKQGTITNERADVLVNVVGERCNFSTSVVCRHFISKGGPEVEKNYMLAHQQRNELQYVVIAGTSGRLQCKSVCHLKLPKFTGDKSILRTAIGNCLRSCSRMNVESVAFPAVGSGQLLGYPIDHVIDCLINESKVAGQKSQCLKKIKFIIYDESHVSKFREILKGSSPSSNNNPHHHGSKKHDKEDYETKGGEKYKETVPALSVELYAVSKPEGESIRKELSKQIKDTFLFEEKVKQSQFKALSDDVKKKMYSTAKKNHVWIKIENGCVTMRGEKDVVVTTKSELLLLVLNDNENPSKNQRGFRRSKCPPGSTGWWMEKRQEDTRVPVNWENFQSGEGLFDKVKGALNKQGKLVEVHYGLRDKIIALVKKTWDPSLVGKGSDAQGLERLGYTRIKVTKVERVENYDLFEKYHLKKKDFYQKLSVVKKYRSIEDISTKGQKQANGPILTTKHIDQSLMVDMDLAKYANEHYFFHGTKNDFINNIIHKGLDDKLGKGMFGQGIYGAEDFTKADQYADDDQAHRQLKNRKMLLMRLLLGNMFLTSKKQDFRRPPCSKCFEENCLIHTHEQFDSVVGHESWLFREFVVYRSQQCYPEYVITYDREK